MRFRFSRSIGAAAVVTMFIATTASAQASRTWVSGVGDDANPCSRTAPCKTFAGAISKTAARGEIDALDPGGFGAVTITKSITLDGGGGQVASILVTGTPGIIISASNTDFVHIRNLSINGVGSGTYGIRVLSAKSVEVEHCAIFGFNGSPGRGISVELNSGTAPIGGMFLNVLDTTFFNNAQTHIVVLPSAGQPIVFANIADSRISYSTANSGIAITEGGRATIRHCEISHNMSGAGVFVDGTVSPGQVTITDSNVSFNANGVQVNGSSIARLGGNTITGNTSNGLNLTGGTMFTFGTNQIDGNGGNNGTGMTAVVPSIQPSQK